MKKHKNIALFVCGFISATAIFLFSNSALASNVLQAIYVDLTPIKVFIEGSEKTPPADMQPLVYNNRVYVPLRYIGEAFGKQVEWNGATRTVTIDTAKTLLNSWSETFIDTPLSKYWTKSGGAVWTFEGPNGLKATDGIGDLILDGILPDGQCNYAVEFEGANASEVITELYLGRNSDNTYGDQFWFSNNGTINNPDGRIANIDSPNDGEYVSIKLQVIDRQVNIYMNGKFITSHTLSMDKSAFAFHHYRNHNYYIRNFKITINN